MSGNRAVSRRRFVPMIGVVVALLAAACGGSKGAPSATGDTAPVLPACPVRALDGATTPVEVVVWHSWQAKQGDALRELADQYNASQSRVHVQVEAQSSSDEELLRKFTAAVPSRQLPALFVGNESETQAMVDSKVILPAQSCVEADRYDLSPFASTALDFYRVDGVLWPVTANPSSVILYYNREHFRRAGLDPDKPPSTLAELRADAEKIKAAGIVDKPFVHETNAFETEYWLNGARAPIVDNDNGRSAPATAAALQGNDKTLELFNWFKGMNDAGLLQAIPPSEGQINQYLAMANQQASMLVEPSGAATSVESFMAGNLDTASVGAAGVTNNGLDISAGPLPGLDGAGRTKMGGQAWFLTSTTPDAVQAGAWDFVKFLNTEPAQVKLLVEGSYLPFRTSAASTPEAQQFFSSSLAGRWLKLANDQLLAIDPSFPGALIGPYSDTRDSLRDALGSVVYKGTAPESAIATSQQQITAAIDNYRQGGF